MEQDQLFGITLWQIHVFMQCYDLKNYSEVARRCSYTPSAISKSIHKLERTLGFRLFNGQNNDLAPTKEAAFLAIHWSDLEERMLRGVEAAEKLKSQKFIKLGVLSDSDFCSMYVYDRLETNGSAQLLDHVQRERLPMVDLPEALRRDKMDAVVVTSTFLPRLVEKANVYQWRKIVSAPDAVFIPQGHPLFRQNIYSFAAFRDCEWLVYDPDYFPEAYERLRLLAAQYDFQPKIGMICTSTKSLYDNLNQGRGINLGSSFFNCDVESDSVRKYVLGKETERSLLIAWKKGNLNPWMEELVWAIAP